MAFLAPLLAAGGGAAAAGGGATAAGGAGAAAGGSSAMPGIMSMFAGAGGQGQSQQQPQPPAPPLVAPQIQNPMQSFLSQLGSQQPINFIPRQGA